MRCEHCGRPLKNALMWQLGGDHHAPASRSLRQLCWECRERAANPEPVTNERSSSILAEAYAIVLEAESRNA
jgi:hypothetical protein